MKVRKHSVNAFSAPRSTACGMRLAAARVAARRAPARVAALSSRVMCVPQCWTMWDPLPTPGLRKKIHDRVE